MYDSHDHFAANQSVDGAWRQRASRRNRARSGRRGVLVVEALEVRRLLANATVSIVSSITAPVYSDQIHFTAVVSGANPGGPTPMGAVQFYLDGSPVGPAFPLSGG